MKKFLCCCLTLVLCLAFTSVYAAESDIEDVNNNTFYDTRNTKYEGVVERIARLGIINGTSETTFSPNKGVTRAELAKIITKMKGLDEYIQNDGSGRKAFSDVDENAWYYPYVLAADNLNLIKGYGDGTFKPSKEVTYAELVAILLRNLGYDNISEDNPNGWYFNYLKKMRELELNDNAGEFDYTKAAKRGDVAIFVWNALITDQWVVSSASSKNGFSYTYADETPLEAYFAEYKFIDEKVINDIGYFGDELGIKIASEGWFYTREKLPLHALGGEITALYNEESDELIGVSIDDDLGEVEVVSGPDFYLKKEGYDLNSAKKIVSYGNKSDANYIYIVIGKEDQEAKRAVYVDASDSIVIKTVSSVDSEAEDDESEEDEDGKKKKIITINDEVELRNFIVYENGFSIGINNINKDKILTNLGNGLYVISDDKFSGILTDYDSSKDKFIINGEEYIISENCMCDLYQASELVKFKSLSTKEVKEHIGKEIEVTLNIAEEICKITFGKTKKDEQKYQIGYVIGAYYGRTEDMQRIKINMGDEVTNYIDINIGVDNMVSIGDMVVLKDDSGDYSCEKISKDKSFDNDIAIKYNYDAKEIDYPMIGEYIVTEDTLYYKVNMEYEENSVTKVKKCEIEEVDFGDKLEDLSAYAFSLVYNEDMEILKIYAINDVNKFDTRIALIKDVEVIVSKDKDDNVEESYKATMRIINDVSKKYAIETNHLSIESGDIVTFSIETDSKSSIVVIEENFKNNFIGYKYDLIVEKFDADTKEITFENGEVMKLSEDIYNFGSTKINLNKYRFVLADVEYGQGKWRFTSVDMFDKEKLELKFGDRVAIGELDDVIVVYRGYQD